MIKSILSSDGVYDSNIVFSPKEKIVEMKIKFGGEIMGIIKVGIEQNLNNVIRHLEDNDIHVEILKNWNKESGRAINKYDALVVSGTDINLMGIQDTIGKTRVINAAGMSPEEVYQEIISRPK